MRNTTPRVRVPLWSLPVQKDKFSTSTIISIEWKQVQKYKKNMTFIFDISNYSEIYLVPYRNISEQINSIERYI